MSITDRDSLGRLLNGPHIDSGIDTARGQVLAIRGPRDSVNGGRVEDPSLDLELLGGGVPHKDVAGRVRRGEELPVRGVRDGREGAADAGRDHRLLDELLPVKAVDVDGLVVLPAHGDLVLGGVDGHAGRREGHGDLADDLVVADDGHRLDGRGDHSVALLAGSDPRDRALDVDPRGRVLAGGDGREADGVVHRAGHELVALDGNAGNGVLVPLAHKVVVGAGGGVPGDDLPVVAAAVDGPVDDAEGGEGLVVPGNHAGGLGRGEILPVEVGDLTLEVHGEDGVAGPDAAQLLVSSLGLGKPKAVPRELLPGRGLPNGGSLVRRARHKALPVGGPREPVDAGLVPVPLAQLLAGLPVVDNDLLVRRARRDEVPGGREAHAGRHAGVVAHGLLELERRALKPVGLEVLAAGRDAEGTRRAEVARDERLGVPRDLTDGAAGVPGEHAAELLAPVAHNEDTLAVPAPGDVADGAGDGVELDLQGVLLLGGVPDAEVALDIAGRNVEPRGAVLGGGGLAGVLEVHVGDKRVLDVADHDGVAAGVDNVPGLGVVAQEDGRATLGLGERCIGVLKSSRHFFCCLLLFTNCSFVS